jgi:multiple sugar transport system ATP-binding protein
VARFIGTPEMNLVDAKDAAAAGLCRDLPSSVATIGARAEDVKLSSGVAAKVDVVEHLGPEVLVHLRVGDIALCARTITKEAPRSGESVTVAIDRARLHCFDADENRVQC